MERDHVLVAKDKRILTYKVSIDSKSISRESLYVHDVDGVNSSVQKWPFDEKYDILGSVSHPALLAVRHLASVWMSIMLEMSVVHAKLLETAMEATVFRLGSQCPNFNAVRYW